MTTRHAVLIPTTSSCREPTPSLTWGSTSPAWAYSSSMWVRGTAVLSSSSSTSPRSSASCRLNSAGSGLPSAPGQMFQWSFGGRGLKINSKSQTVGLVAACAGHGRAGQEPNICTRTGYLSCAATRRLALPARGVTTRRIKPPKRCIFSSSKSGRGQGVRLSTPSSASRILRLCSYLIRSLPSRLLRYRYSRRSLVFRRIMLRQMLTKLSALSTLCAPSCRPGRKPVLLRCA